ncbi:MAG: electron transport complex subunit E [Clostridia bacterium]|nr:electron transport complex subunit E [Clostridia bacterium]
MKSKGLLSVLTSGIIKENPVLKLLLGTCATLAVTTSASNAIGMGAATTFVLIGSNATIAALRNFIPDKVRIPAFITIIAGFVTIVQMVVKAYTPSLDQSLGIFLPLIVVNCIILGRAEMFARKNKVLPSVLDGLGMGIGFTVALLLMGAIRELFGAGTLFSIPITQGFVEPMLIFILPPGGFFVFGLLIALANKIGQKDKDKDNQPKNKNKDLACASCPLGEACQKTCNKGER